MHNLTNATILFSHSLRRVTRNTTTVDPSQLTNEFVAVTFISFLIICINSLTISAYIKGKVLRKSSANALITSQACSDLFTGAVFSPTHLIETYYQKHLISPFLIGYMLFLSLFNLLALSVDRYLALSKPFLHYRIIILKRTVRLIFLIWISPLVLTLIPLLWWFEEYHAQAQNIYLGIMWTIMLCMVVFMTILYIYVTFRARKLIRTKRLSIVSNSSTRSNHPLPSTNVKSLVRKELRVVYLFGLLLLFFATTYLPILYMNLCDIISKVNYIPDVLGKITFYMILCNSIFNPVLCIFLKKDYYHQIRQIYQGVKNKSIHQVWYSTRNENLIINNFSKE